MFASCVTRRIALVSSVVAAAVLVACSSSDSSVADTNVTITPALGAVYGGSVSVYNAAGTLLGTGTTGSTTGTASVKLTNYVTGTPILVKVSMVNGSTYFDEKSGTVKTVTVAAGGTPVSLVSFKPSVTSGGSVGVTPLTNMAAKAAGIDASALTGAALTTPLTATAINTAVAKVNLFLGLPTSTNLLAAPVPATLAAPLPTNTYGLLLAKLAAAASTDALAQSSALVAAVGTTGDVVSGNVAAINAANTALATAASAIGVTISAPNIAPSASQVTAAAAAVASTISADTAPTGSTGSTGSTGGVSL
jgi:hypothetical protein